MHGKADLVQNPEEQTRCVRQMVPLCDRLGLSFIDWFVRRLLKEAPLAVSQIAGNSEEWPEICPKCSRRFCNKMALVAHAKAHR